MIVEDAEWEREIRMRERNGGLLRGPDPDRVAQHLATSEPKWGLERRRAIVRAMGAGHRRKHDVITYTRKVCRALNLTHFFDEVAKESDMQHVERLLGL